jgi:hypothetical protein
VIRKKCLFKDRPHAIISGGPGDMARRERERAAAAAAAAGEGDAE